LGLGLAACQRGLKVRFTTAAALVHDLIEAQDERRLQRLQKQLASQNLLIMPSHRCKQQVSVEGRRDR
jgi:DNA replication protein DnaC